MRRGYVHISHIRLEENPKWLVDFLSEFKETRERKNAVIGDRNTNMIEMVGAHPAFEDIDDSLPTPQYAVDEFGIYKIVDAQA